MRELRAGEIAPDFELPDQNGSLFHLSHFRGHNAVVLFFYPKDDTTGCTKEACGFRDNFAQFDALCSKIVGISADSSTSHARFAAKYSLPYTLLSDTEGRVRRLYSVKSSFFGIVPGRATYVIDRKGILRRIFSSQSKPERHIEEALGALRGCA